MYVYMNIQYKVLLNYRETNWNGAGWAPAPGLYMAESALDDPSR